MQTQTDQYILAQATRILDTIPEGRGGRAGRFLAICRHLEENCSNPNTRQLIEDKIFDMLRDK